MWYYKKSQNEAIYFQYSHLGNMPDFCGKNHCCRHRSETTRNKSSSSVGHTLSNCCTDRLSQKLIEQKKIVPSIKKLPLFVSECVQYQLDMCEYVNFPNHIKTCRPKIKGLS